MRNITVLCKSRAVHSQIKDIDGAIGDAIELAMEITEAIIVEVRSKDTATEWRAACDEILDRIKEEF